MTHDDTANDWSSRAASVVLAVWTVALLLAMDPYTPDPAGDIKRLLIAWGAVLLGALAVLAPRGEGGRLLQSFVGVLLLSWLAINAASSALVIVAQDARPGLFDVATLPLIATLPNIVSWVLLAVGAAHALRSEARIWRFAQVFVVALALASCYGFLQRLGLDPFPWETRAVEEYRGLPATFGNPNFAGHVLVLGIPLATALLLRRESRWALVPLAILVLHLALTGMRGGPLGLFAAGVLVAAWWLTRRAERPGRTLFAAGGALALLGVLGVALHGLVRGRPFPLDASLLLRYNDYLSAAKMALAKPWLGYGPGRYWIENPRFWTDFEQLWFAVTNRRNFETHNEYLGAAVDAGFPGAMVYAGLLLAGVILGLGLALPRANSRNSRLLGLALAAAFTAFAVDGLFGFNARVPASAAMIAVLLGTAGMLTHRRPMPPRAARVLAVLLLLAGLGAATLESLRYATGRALQSAEGAMYYAREARARGEEPLAMQYANAAAELLTRAPLRKVDYRVPLAQAEVQRFSIGALPVDVFYEAASEIAPNQPRIIVGPPGASLITFTGRESLNLVRHAEALCAPLPEAHFREGVAYLPRVPSMPVEAMAGKLSHGRLQQALRYGYPDRNAVLEKMMLAGWVRDWFPNAMTALRLRIENDPTPPDDLPAYRLEDLNDEERALLVEGLFDALAVIDDAPERAEERLKVAVLLAQVLPEDEAPAQFLRPYLVAAPDNIPAWNVYAKFFDDSTRNTALRAAIAEANPRALPSVLRRIQIGQGEALAAAADEMVRVRQENASINLGWLGALIDDTAASATMTDEQRVQVNVGLARWAIYGNIQRLKEWISIDLTPLRQSLRAVAYIVRAEALAVLGEQEAAIEAARTGIELGGRRAAQDLYDRLTALQWLEAPVFLDALRDMLDETP